MKKCPKCNRNYDGFDFNDLSVCLNDGEDLVMVLVLNPETVERMKTQGSEGYWNPPNYGSRKSGKSVLIWAGLSFLLLLIFLGLAVFPIFQGIK